MIRFILVEDQTLLREALSQLLDLQPDFQCLATFEDGQEALTWLDAQTEAPDLLLTDIEMPNLTGIELAETLKASYHPTKRVVLTTFARAGYLRRAMDAGVVGYLLKDTPTDELSDALRKINAGRKVIAPELMANSWMEQDPLTDKERKALRLAHQGLSTEQIAETLFLSQGTIRNYLSNAATKLHAQNRVDAARIAHQNGWL